MSEKPVVRVPAGMSYTADSFVNLQARLGLGTANQTTGSGYLFKNLTQNRVLLEASYETSWMIGRGIDITAEDMTKAGIEIESSLPPVEEQAIYAAMRDLLIMQDLGEAIKWGRLYGGCLTFMMIDGQNSETPLNLNSIGPGQFKGLQVLDRWTAIPEAGQIVTDFGADFGLPKFYIVFANPAQGIPTQMRIHHSRVGRHGGIKLPFNRRQIYQLWDASIVERVWDRIIAFDSTSTGVAQLAYKAHLRTIFVDNYRQLVAAGGQLFEGFAKQMEMIRMFQSSEGLTVLDAADKMEHFTQTFAGLVDILGALGDQVCGAFETPRVRFFGESPGGLGSNGDGELKTYYGDNTRRQEAQLRRPMTTLMDVICRSVLKKPPPPGFGFSFRSLWEMSDTERAEIGAKNTKSITDAFTAGLLTEQTAARELRGQSRVTGLFSNITDEDIAGMADEIPDPVEMAQAMAEATGENEAEGEKKEAAE